MIVSSQLNTKILTKQGDRPRGMLEAKGVDPQVAYQIDFMAAVVNTLDTCK